MKKILLLGVVLALAGVGPIIFPLAQSGHGTMPIFATRVLLPAVVGLVLIALLNRNTWPALTRDILGGVAAGALATVALELIRIPGFELGYMPGNLPRLMGVLLLDRFAQGPSTASDVIGWAYHFWNGASFGVIFAIALGTKWRWLGAAFGVVVGLGFLVSPVVMSLGVGMFGLEFSVGFPITVLLAHLAFGLVLGILAQRFTGVHSSRLFWWIDDR